MENTSNKFKILLETALEIQNEIGIDELKTYREKDLINFINELMN